ncbi:MAG: hypothetical protein RL095_65 [Verrucomicrobiota bacterium]|jgi:hypothetical protein
MPGTKNPPSRILDSQAKILSPHLREYGPSSYCRGILFWALCGFFILNLVRPLLEFAFDYLSKAAAPGVSWGLTIILMIYLLHKWVSRYKLRIDLGQRLISRGVATPLVPRYKWIDTPIASVEAIEFKTIPWRHHQQIGEISLILKDGTRHWLDEGRQIDELKSFAAELAELLQVPLVISDNKQG